MAVVLRESAFTGHGAGVPTTLGPLLGSQHRL